jgi:hypothetical protein
VGWLQNARVALRDFLTWAKDKTNRLRSRTEQMQRQQAGRSNNLKGFLDKEAHVAKIAGSLFPPSGLICLDGKQSNRAGRHPKWRVGWILGPTFQGRRESTSYSVLGRRQR